jgi:hypothetical protein
VEPIVTSACYFARTCEGWPPIIHTVRKIRISHTTCFFGLRQDDSVMDIHRREQLFWYDDAAAGAIWAQRGCGVDIGACTIESNTVSVRRPQRWILVDKEVRRNRGPGDPASVCRSGKFQETETELDSPRTSERASCSDETAFRTSLRGHL